MPSTSTPLRPLLGYLIVGAVVAVLLIFLALRPREWHSSLSYPLPSSPWDVSLPTKAVYATGDGKPPHSLGSGDVGIHEAVSPDPIGSESNPGLVTSGAESRHDRTIVKPPGVKVYALIPFGRPSHIEILNCYLQKNLVKNGGVLDEVHFALNTGNQAAKDWMKAYAAQFPEYRTIDLEGAYGPEGFFKLYNQTLHRGHIYVKIDDDTTWLADGAISELVAKLLSHRDAFLVGANIASATCELNWMHLRSGALHTYLPEQVAATNSSSDSYGPTAWRVSALPTFNDAVAVESTPFPPSAGLSREADEKINQYFDVPFHNHRWLPLRDDDKNLLLTPAHHQGYCTDSGREGYGRWEIAAQAHYSLLENIEKDQLHLYDFGGRDGLWNMRYEHLNLNVIAAWADDILDAAEMDNPLQYNDEWFLTMQAPRNLKRQVYVATKALASHFSHGPQGGGMYETDMLHRWRAYANERICPSNMQIPVKQGDWFGRSEAYPFLSEGPFPDHHDSEQDLRSLPP